MLLPFYIQNVNKQLGSYRAVDRIPYILIICTSTKMLMNYAASRGLKHKAVIILGYIFYCEASSVVKAVVLYKIH